MLQLFCGQARPPGRPRQAVRRVAANLPAGSAQGSRPLRVAAPKRLCLYHRSGKLLTNRGGAASPGALLSIRCRRQATALINSISG